jgi:GT2 family glycosyltransferase
MGFAEQNGSALSRAMVTKDVSVIVVNYNVRDLLEQCLRSIHRACEHLDAEVLVVDNASRDSSSQMVEDKFPWVQLIQNQVNVGFSRANNQALERARGRYFLLINPDTLAREDTVQTMMDFMDAHPEAGAAGCKILNPDGTLQLSCRRSFPTPWVALSKILGLGRLFPRSRVFGKYNLTYLNPDQTAEVDALSGSFMFLRRETLKEIGLLDEHARHPDYSLQGPEH